MPAPPRHPHRGSPGSAAGGVRRGASAKGGAGSSSVASWVGLERRGRTRAQLPSPSLATAGAASESDARAPRREQPRAGAVAGSRARARSPASGPVGPGEARCIRDVRGGGRERSGDRRQPRSAAGHGAFPAARRTTRAQTRSRAGGRGPEGDQAQETKTSPRLLARRQGDPSTQDAGRVPSAQDGARDSLRRVGSVDDPMSDVPDGDPPGHLVIHTMPWSAVWVDDVSIGNTPIRNYSLPTRGFPSAGRT